MPKLPVPPAEPEIASQPFGLRDLLLGRLWLRRC